MESIFFEDEYFTQESENEDDKMGIYRRRKCKVCY